MQIFFSSSNRALLAFSAIIFIIACSDLPAQNLPLGNRQIRKEKQWKIGLSVGSHTASRYYDKNGNEKTRLTDSISVKIEDPDVSIDTTLDIEREYTFEFKKFTIALIGEYYPDDNLQLHGEVPISFYSLDERFTQKNVQIEDAGVTRTYKLDQAGRTDLTRTRVDYINIGAQYRYFESIISLTALADVYIPTSFERGQFRPQDELLSDGTFSYSAGTRLSLDLEKANISSSVLYNGRGEDFEDRLIIAGKLALRTVASTELAVIGTYYLPVEDIILAPEYKLRHEEIFGEALTVGINFAIVYDENYFGEFGYTLTALGKNLKGIGGLNIKAGIFL